MNDVSEFVWCFGHVDKAVWHPELPSRHILAPAVPPHHFCPPNCSCHWRVKIQAQVSIFINTASGVLLWKEAAVETNVSCDGKAHRMLISPVRRQQAIQYYRLQKN